MAIFFPREPNSNLFEVQITPCLKTENANLHRSFQIPSWFEPCIAVSLPALKFLHDVSIVRQGRLVHTSSGFDSTNLGYIFIDFGTPVGVASNARAFILKLVQK